MSEFWGDAPSIENYWRSIILFGKNVASYKFALAQSLRLSFLERWLFKLAGRKNFGGATAKHQAWGDTLLASVAGCDRRENL